MSCYWALLILVVLGLFILIFGWMLLRVGTGAREVERRLDAEGVDGEGTVTAHRISQSRRGADYYHLSYQYTVRRSDGTSQTLTAETMVSRQDYDHYNPGDRIAVRYLADVPDVVRLSAGIHETVTAARMRLNGILVMLVGLVPIGLAAGLFYSQIRNVALPGTSPHGRLLVPMLVSSDRSENQIFRFDLDGSGRTNLTNTQADEQAPAWSPDGKQIAFVSQRDGVAQIYVMNADGSSPKNVSAQAKHDDSDPVWSPDGKQILFHTSRLDSQTEARLGEIWLVGVDGTNEKDLSSRRAQDDSRGVWSPDGSRIVFSSSSAAGSAIWIMDANGNDPIQLTPANSQDAGPVWAPDGTWIAFVRGYKNSAIWRMNADGTNPRQLASVSSLTPGLAWSPDGQALAFISAPSGFSEVYVMQADGGSLHPAASARAADLSFTWSPDSKQILVESNLTGDKLGVLMLIDLAAKTRKTIVDDAYCGSIPAWMPNPARSVQ